MNKLKILEDLDRIEENFARSDTQNIKIDHKSYVIEIDGDIPKIYRPSETFKKLHADKKSKVKFIMGAYGSGKSTGMCAEIMLQACSIPPCRDGVRRSKWVVIRNTTGELKTTTLRTWLHWFDGVGTLIKKEKPVLTYQHIFNDGVGKIELELIFLALDRPEDIERAKSMEATGAYINELSHIALETLTHMRSRVNNRYPSSTMIDGSYWSGIIADSNPPDTDHWIYRMFEVDRPRGYAIYRQPPGLIKDNKGEYVVNTDCDNYANLVNKNYYLDIAEGSTKEFINVYCLGEYGTVILGRKIYESYNDDIHCMLNLRPEPGSQLVIGWDFALHPACVIAQLTSNGQIRVLKEFYTEEVSIRTLAANFVVPYLHANFKDYPYISIGDPSDSMSPSTRESCIMILDECGIATSKAITNNIVKRIDAVDSYLSKLIAGKPALVVSKEGCPYLRKGFLGKYNYKRLRVLGEEKFQDAPDKTHPYSDLHDCLQYICLQYAIEIKKPISSDDCYEQTPGWC